MRRVPQGSILILVINDLNDWVQCIFSKFTEAQHCGQLLVHQRALLPSRRTVTGWKVGLTKILLNSTRRTAKSCTRGEIIPDMVQVNSY